MMYRNNAFKRIILVVISMMLLVAVPFSYTFWHYFGAEKTSDLTFPIGEWDGDGNEDIVIGEIPSYSPYYIKRRVKQLQDEAALTPQELDILIDNIIMILDDPQFNFYENHIFIAPNIDRLFDPHEETGKEIMQRFDSLVYFENGKIQTVWIGGSLHNLWNPVRNAEHLREAIDTSWSGINLLVTSWMPNTQYNSETAPIEYEGNYYLARYGVNTTTPPPQNTGPWFRVPSGEYIANQIYVTGYIVLLNGEHFIATGYAGTTPPSTSSWAWSQLTDYDAQTNYTNSSYVRTADASVEGGFRFWLSLRTQRGTSPSEESARNGDWRELKSAWVGPSQDNIVRHHYFEHNTYQSGNIIVHNRFKNVWRYYRARRNVPADQPPTIRAENGTVIVNEQYWESINT